MARRFRALETDFDYFTNISLRYTFGSIFNNIVNSSIRRRSTVLLLLAATLRVGVWSQHTQRDPPLGFRDPGYLPPGEVLGSLVCASLVVVLTATPAQSAQAQVMEGLRLEVLPGSGTDP